MPSNVRMEKRLPGELVFRSVSVKTSFLLPVFDEKLSDGTEPVLKTGIFCRDPGSVFVVIGHNAVSFAQRPVLLIDDLGVGQILNNGHDGF